MRQPTNNPRPPTHKELVRRAGVWLRQAGYKLVVTEAVTHAQEIPDAIGWKNGKWSAMIECKASRSDFRQDAKKPSRKNPDKKLGQVRYYMAPEGVIPLDELPEGWGLLEVKNKVVKVTVKAPRLPYDNKVAANELLILTHLLRRAEIRGVNLSETWHDYLKSQLRKKRRINLGDDDDETF